MVEPSKVTSGMILFTKNNLCPSSRSKSADVINAVIAAGVPVSLSSSPCSCSTNLPDVVAASGWSLAPESTHAVRVKLPKYHTSSE
jgi:hypothetical protein